MLSIVNDYGFESFEKQGYVRYGYHLVERWRQTEVKMETEKEREREGNNARAILNDISKVDENVALPATRRISPVRRKMPDASNCVAHRKNKRFYTESI